MRETLRELLAWINKIQGGIVEIYSDDYIRKERIFDWIKLAIKCSADQVYTVTDPYLIPEFENSLYRHPTCKFCYILLFRDEGHNAQKLTSHLENSLVVRFLRKRPTKAQTGKKAVKKHESDTFKLVLPNLKGAELITWIQKELDQHSLNAHYSDMLLAQTESLDELVLLIKKLSLCDKLETKNPSEVVFNLLRKEKDPRKLLNVLRKQYEDDPGIIFPVLGYLVKRNISSQARASLPLALHYLRADSLLKGYSIDKFAVIENLLLQSHLK